MTLKMLLKIAILVPKVLQKSKSLKIFKKKIIIFLAVWSDPYLEILEKYLKQIIPDSFLESIANFFLKNFVQKALEYFLFNSQILYGKFLKIFLSFRPNDSFWRFLSRRSFKNVLKNLLFPRNIYKKFKKSFQEPKNV